MSNPTYRSDISELQERFGNYLPFQRSISADTPEDEYTKGGAPGENEQMVTGVTHYELDAKIESLEARADARFSKLETSINNALDEMRRDRGEFKSELSAEQLERRAEMKSLKNTFIATGIGVALTIVFGVVGFNTMLVSNMVASFESGKNTATAISQASEQMKQTQDQLKDIQQKLAEQAKDQTAVVRPR